MVQTQYVQRYGPWAIVTGASSGIGQAFAEHLARQGIHLVLVSRTTDRLRELGNALTAAHGVRHRVLALDLEEPDAATRLVEATADLDVGLLVSNAGAGRPGLLLEQDLAALHKRFQLNAVSHLELAHHIGRRLVARGGGGILLVAALGGHGIPHMAHDSAAKGYVLNLGEALHHELKGAGVDVTVLLPGNVETPIIDKLGIDRKWMPLRTLPADTAVREAMRALAKGRPRHVPGRLMRNLSRLLPRALSVRVNGRMLGRAAQALQTREAGARA
ncbi:MULTISPECIES: SDR family NAD(P)-dependent oxidoreductase [unclassified Streptomyces]|uniref:SDR family NAD(P)-dependent oxidoreductase n=1 Tax=unclassified Streptomyces TaxID=2593676 RepID=UPI003D7382EA